MKGYAYLLLLAALLLMPAGQSEIVTALASDDGLWCRVHEPEVSLLGGRTLACMASTPKRDKAMYSALAAGDDAYVYCERGTCWQYVDLIGEWRVFARDVAPFGDRSAKR